MSNHDCIIADDRRLSIDLADALRISQEGGNLDAKTYLEELMRMNLRQDLRDGRRSLPGDRVRDQSGPVRIAESLIPDLSEFPGSEWDEVLSSSMLSRWFCRYQYMML